MFRSPSARGGAKLFIALNDKKLFVRLNYKNKKIFVLPIF